MLCTTHRYIADNCPDCVAAAAAAAAAPTPAEPEVAAEPALEPVRCTLLVPRALDVEVQVRAWALLQSLRVVQLPPKAHALARKLERALNEAGST